MKNSNTPLKFNSVQDAVHHYIDLGWKVFPLAQGQKRPKQSGYQKLEIAHENVEEHFGHGENVAVFLGPVSNNLVDIDLDSPEAVIAAKMMLPPTNAVFGRKGSRSSHYFYTCQKPGKAIKFEPKEKKGQSSSQPAQNSLKSTILEVRSSESGRKQFTSLPPNHIAEYDEIVEWEGACEPAQVDFNELVKASRRCAAAAYIGRNWPHRGSRHDAGLALAGYLLAGGISLEDAEAIMRAVCAVASDEDIEDRLVCIHSTQLKYEHVEPIAARNALIGSLGEEVVATLDDWLEIAPASKTRKSGSKATDEGLDTELSCAERFVEKYAHEIRYGAEEGIWYIFNGTHWTQDRTQAVKARVAQFTKNLLAEAQKEPNPYLRSNLEKSARAMQSNHRINGLLSLASSIQDIGVLQSQWDTHRHLLNCPNGTLDLETGVLTKHDPAHLLTQCTRVNYNPSAQAPAFQQFLREIFQDDFELIAFVQKVLSIGLVGGNPEQQMYILHGQGANGKSVLIDAITHVLGSGYTRHLASYSLLVNGKSSGARPDLACLKGTRMAVAPEINAEMQLDEALVKSLTACDMMSTRGMYEGMSEFRPELTIFQHTNHMPVIKGNGLGIWRRMVVIPFEVSIPSDKQNPKLPEILKSEAEGILAWLVEGFRKYQEEGLAFPDAVNRKLGKYRKAMDPIGSFLEERVMVKANAGVGASVTCPRFMYQPE